MIYKRRDSHDVELCTNTGAPMGCVLSQFLFSVYTNEVQSRGINIKSFKYADDMAIVGLLNHTKPDDFYFLSINDFSAWCKDCNLILNTRQRR